MLIQSQPISHKISEKLESNKKDEMIGFSDANIKAQFIGSMFDDIIDKSDKCKITIWLRFSWLWRDIINTMYDLKFAVRNYFKWRKTIKELRPWEGFDGLISVMITHLNDYIETEEKYGHSEEEYKKHKVAAAKETVEILERMKDPDKYLDKPLKEVKSNYPEYKGLVTNYKNGGSSFSGDFVAQGDGWAGTESGKDPRKGYFEFIDGLFVVTKSPDKNETDRLLMQLEKYHEEVHEAYQQGNMDSDRDFERLGHLLKENLYSWWD